MDLVLLCGMAGLAGLVDAVVGGGGLIQLPALLLFLPSSVASGVATVLGTNKLSSICGTGMAVVQYARRVRIPWATVVPAAGTALGLSWCGARLATALDPALMRPLVLVLLVGVALHTFFRRALGERHAPRFGPGPAAVWAAVVGAGIGFYDGFFGPGTGSFLIFVFVSLFGFDFLTASASAKLVNFATNLSAMVAFAWSDQILYRYALPMAVCNVVGSIVGTRLAVLKGNRWVRRFFLGVVSVLILKLGWDLIREQ